MIIQIIENSRNKRHLFFFVNKYLRATLPTLLANLFLLTSF